MGHVLKTKRMLTTSTLVVALCMTFTGMARASTIIKAGFDLFQTQTPGTSFDFDTVPNPQVVDFEGSPLNIFDFGTGAINVGTADTIVERLQDANLGGGFDTIDIEMVALSLVSVAPVDLGFGAGFEDLFITLNTSSPSIQSKMAIFDTGEGSPHGTFDSQLNFSFDVTGSVGGFYATLEKTFLSTDNDWQHAPTGLPLIDGINHLLDGSTELGDFWLDGIALHDTGGGQHTVTAAPPIPEPSGGLLALVGVGFAGLAANRRRKR